MGNGETVLLLCDSHLGTSNDWTGERGTKEVDILVDSVAR